MLQAEERTEVEAGILNTSSKMLAMSSSRGTAARAVESLCHLAGWAWAGRPADGKPSQEEEVEGYLCVISGQKPLSMAGGRGQEQGAGAKPLFHSGVLQTEYLCPSKNTLTP